MSIQTHAYLFQSRFLYLYLFFVYPPILFSISCLSTSISLYLFANLNWSISIFISFVFNTVSFYLFVDRNSRLLLSISVYFLYIHLWQSKDLGSNPSAVESVFFSTEGFSNSLNIFFNPWSIHLYLFLSLCQFKLTPISFNPVFFISIYSSYIHLYLFLSLVYPPLFLYTSLSIQTDAYLFQLHFLYLSLNLIYPPVSIFIFFLSTIISFYLFVNPNPRLYLLIPFSLFLSIFCIFTYICFYPSSNQLYLFLSLCITSSLHLCIRREWCQLSLSVAFFTFLRMHASHIFTFAHEWTLLIRYYHLWRHV